MAIAIITVEPGGKASIVEGATRRRGQYNRK